MIMNVFLWFAFREFDKQLFLVVKNVISGKNIIYSAHFHICPILS